MTFDQILWASKHDWFRAHRPADDAVRVYDSATNERLYFTDYIALREWAGY